MAEALRRRRLFTLLVSLVLGTGVVGAFAASYLSQPRPLQEMIPIVGRAIGNPPTYKQSISGVDAPVSVALSPDGERLYVAESGGQRLVKIFDRQGQLLGSFGPAGTDSANREPKYLAVAPSGQVLLVDRTANAIHIFDADGRHLDAIVAANLTLTRFLSESLQGAFSQQTAFRYDGINRLVYYTQPGGAELALPLPPSAEAWAPMGVRFDAAGNLLITEISAGQHRVRRIASADFAGDLSSFNPRTDTFGSQGNGPGQFEFPQVAVRDSRGNFYVADGNNFRISLWNANMRYESFFAFGYQEGGLNLPRGMWIDARDRLYVADAVGAYVRVYDVSVNPPSFLFNFGDYGIGGGQFVYPMDVTLDASGRLYIADRENDRVQLWSY